MSENNWVIIDSFFRDNEKFLVSHQLDSFNDFIQYKIPNIIKSFNPIITYKEDISENSTTKKFLHEIYVYIGGENGDKIYINKPIIDENKLLFPNTARLRNYDYSSYISVDVHIKYVTNEPSGVKTETKVFEKITIGKIPIMLGSKYCALYNANPDYLTSIGECRYDNGGYFIINGKEKVVIAQESICNNRIFITKNKEDESYTYTAKVKSKLDNTNDIPKTLSLMILRNGDDDLKIREGSIVVSISGISRMIPLFIVFRALGIESDSDILRHIFYNIDTNSEYAKMIEDMRVDILGSYNIYDQNSALEYIGLLSFDGTINDALSTLLNDFLPHAGSDFSDKAYFLGYMVFKLLQVKNGIRNVTDRDSYIYRRVELSGFMCSELFREYYKDFRNNVANNVDSQYFYGAWRQLETKRISLLVNNDNKYKIFDSNIIENGFVKSLKGSWGKNPDPLRTGIVQDINRISYVGFCSHLRRTNTPIDRSTKNKNPHLLHGSQWGYICPCESPEGENIGLVKNLALTTHITVECNSTPIKKFLRDYGLIYLYESTPYNMDKTTKIFLNGNWIGLHNDILKLKSLFLDFRRNGLINIFTSFSWNITDMEVFINTDAGRCCRPLLIVDNNNVQISDTIIDMLKDKQIRWKDLIRGELQNNELDYYDCNYYSLTDINTSTNTNTDTDTNTDTNTDEYTSKKVSINIDVLKKKRGIIEYIDSEETNNCLIAMNSEYLMNSINNYTHMEIHPSLIFGVLASNIPFLNSNQAPRNIFSGAQGKQALGIYTSNFLHRYDTMSYLLDYPQRSLVSTRAMKYLHNNDMPNGINAIVAIASFTGYNQEDSIIINRESLQRGLFRTTYYKTIVDTEELTTMGEKIIFCNPLELQKENKDVKNIKYSDYSHLNAYGFVRENTIVDENTILIGKCIVKENIQKKTSFIEETNIKYTYNDMSVATPHTIKGTVDKVYVDFDNKNNKICKVRLRKTKVPMIGDKFCSRAGQKGVLGMVLSACDMPFTADGIVPDIIINPHAFPSRMTIGHLIECLLCKTCAELGFIGDSTPFTNISYDTIGKILQDKCGFEKNGNEIMYNGMSGEQLETEIFIGPTYYQRLKHMVEDKMFSRNTGPLVTRTRQPAEGRGREGGLRLGEMERDAMLSHGILQFLKESFMERSDYYKVYICNKSGTIATVNPDKKIYKSNVIPDNNNDFSEVHIPYSMKLLMQEIESMNLTSRIISGSW